MIEFVIGAFSLVLGYYIGVNSGYQTCKREKLSNQILNVNVHNENGLFLFYDMADGKFLMQDMDMMDGAQKIAEVHGRVVVLADAT